MKDATLYNPQGNWAIKACFFHLNRYYMRLPDGAVGR